MSDGPIALKTKVLQGSAAGPHLLITGGVHGDEFEPMAAIRALIRRIDVAKLRGRLTLVPVVNEAAFWRGHRTADDNRDLARTCPGRPDGSITERTAHALCRLIAAADYYIDLHTGGTTIDIYPLAGYALVADPIILNKQRRMARAFNLPLIWGTTAKLHGRSLSFARDAKVPAIYAEHGGAASCDPRGVDDYIRGCLNVMIDLDMIDGTPPRGSGVRHVVEEEGEQTGHLQKMSPSPMAGHFTPCVKLGDIVTAGQTIGTVTDILGEKTVDVPASNAGLVILVHTFPMVAEGEVLAAIVDITKGGGA